MLHKAGRMDCESFHDREMINVWGDNSGQLIYYTLSKNLIVTMYDFYVFMYQLK
jgi:hypothetical protein